MSSFQRGSDIHADDLMRDRRKLEAFVLGIQQFYEKTGGASATDTAVWMQKIQPMAGVEMSLFLRRRPEFVWDGDELKYKNKEDVEI